MEDPKNNFSCPMEPLHNENVHWTEKVDSDSVTLQNKHSHCTTNTFLNTNRPKQSEEAVSREYR